ncbi:BTB/POZ protein [Geranomyces variabilis]|nr:BTB/POZ protein [Geranomyces variabilis]KAJ3135248.1 hypothetical protein HDU90_003971 [Geranomyces variabilis]
MEPDTLPAPIPNPVVSATHAYEDADVRIVVGDTVFLVHSLCLVLNSEFFKACFRGPWTENSLRPEIPEGSDNPNLRQVTLEDISAEDFSGLLDWIYHTETLLDPHRAFALAQIANRFQVTALLKYLDELKPPSLSWKNIEHWLTLGTKGPYRFTACVNSAVAFLEQAKSSTWIRVLYLAEKYDLPAL